ncbi:hypothetical protein L210DRAFT_3641475 [Boletus edulis BED1]|uniref:ubiquitinyl hydrolase 1 n=1 Tax=Boletus edulis BED1 TaxID=1328754 RepID=A0AAD4C3S7_BOLED|nr:hypothetical protein L210DRAFT_3641475 [Boletus edulis BED1]
MAPVRVRHPKGIATLQLDIDALTVQDLQQQIFTLSEILPSQQEHLVTSQVRVPSTNADPRARTPALKFRSRPLAPAPARQTAAPQSTSPASVPTSAGIT